MTDNELLLAISNIVQSYTNPIQQQLQDTEARLDTKIDALQSHLEGRISSVEAKLENRISSVEAKLESRISSVEATLENRISSVEATLESRISSVEATLENKINALDLELKQTQGDVKQIQILLENDVLPQLQNIESCYISTYQRYTDHVLQVETLQSDVDILKNVVAEHSEILQRIS